MPAGGENVAMSTLFAVDRKDLRQMHWVKRPAEPLTEGQARFRIDRFALTSNNVTYGAFGDTMSYWNFFPTGDATTGCIPVWGFAEVMESRAPGVLTGERFYGYYPMADEVVLQPERLGETGFMDGMAHRRELHSVYNQYLCTDADPIWRANQEGLIALLRPLFTTSFLIDDFLADNDFFGARSVLVSSASSKTAYGLGFCLAARRGSDSAVVTAGMTSARNVGFTRSLGCWDQVVDYTDLPSMSADLPTVYVDMSGSASIRQRVHSHWQDRLKYSCSVGGTHWESLGGSKGLAGPRPALFFAPAQVKKRRDDWGAAVLASRLATAWAGFVEQVSSAEPSWLMVKEARGREAIEQSYVALLDGVVPAREGHVLSL